MKFLGSLEVVPRPNFSLKHELHLLFTSTNTYSLTLTHRSSCNSTKLTFYRNPKRTS